MEGVKISSEHRHRPPSGGNPEGTDRSATAGDVSTAASPRVKRVGGFRGLGCCFEGESGGSLTPLFCRGVKEAVAWLSRNLEGRRGSPRR